LAAVLCVAVIIALSGCGKPGGVDGDLLNGWPAFAKAVTPTPKVGACYDSNYVPTWYGDFNTVPCDEGHQAETAYVGTFTGNDAERSSPPSTNSPSRRAAYSECVKAVKDYLGGDWHTAYVWLGLVLPSTAAWHGGARWYRCDLVPTDDVEYSTARASASVKDGLRGDKPLAITCINTIETKSGGVQAEVPVSCAKPHSAEFVGTATAPNTPWPGEKGAQKQAEKACEAAVAKYMGFSDSSVANQWVGWLFFWPTRSEWETGDRSFTCFAYAFTKSKKMIGSVKGLRGQAPKS
jgi:hypothetical protein